MLKLLGGSGVGVAWCCLLLIGCGPKAAIKTYPVSGKIEVKGGDVAILTASSIELKHDTDETLRPIGNIDATGNFSIKTQYKGEILDGAPEGQYKARIVLADPKDDGVPKRKGDPVHRRFLEFASSGVSLKVPSGDYNVSLAK